MNQSEEKIHAVENGLLPAIVLRGQPIKPGNITDRMQHYETPGVSIAVINAQAIEWARGYGVLEAGGATPVTPQTLFQAASISKPVAAMAALRLVQTGQLDLDEDVNQKLRSWQVPENEHTREHKVTLRGLLSHSAGLTVSGFMGYAAGQPVPTLLQVLDGAGAANSAPIRVEAAPGSVSRYSGGGYVVLQQLLMDVTGRPFPQLMREIVLDKIGMQHSTFEQPLPQERTAQAASGHRFKKVVRGKWHTYPEMAAAGLWTTPSDLARFAIEILRSRTGQSNKTLSADVVEHMLTPQLGEYGLGLVIEEQHGGVIKFFHEGWNEGFRCFLAAYTERGQGIVVMTNLDAGHNLALEIVRSAARLYGWPGFEVREKALATVDCDIYDDYVGKYQFVDEPDYYLVVSRERERLFTQLLPLGRRVELVPESETRYFVVENGVEITFVRSADGQVQELDSSWGQKLSRVA